MKLLIDLGNSAIKWCVISTTGLRHIESHLHQQSPSRLRTLIEKSELPISSIEIACICSVGSKLLEQALIDWLETFCQHSFVSVAQYAYGVHCAYPRVSQFGVDRWVCLVAANAYNNGHAKLIVDVGTAIKLDAMSAQGQHIGGQILPGFELMQSSLCAHTANINEVSSNAISTTWFGNTTVQCITNGTLRAAAALIDASYQQLQTEFGPQSELILCGGGSEMVKPLIQATIRSEPMLIFQGLALIAERQ